MELMLLQGSIGVLALLFGFAAWHMRRSAINSKKIDRAISEVAEKVEKVCRQ